MLTERAASRAIENDVVNRLRKMATTHQSDARRLRALWCLHGIDALDSDLAKQLLADPSEFVRAWTVQLMAESGDIESRDSLLIKQVRKEDSALVKLYLASAAGRMQNETSWQIVETLTGQEENGRNCTRHVQLYLAYHKRYFVSCDRVVTYLFIARPFAKRFVIG